MKILTLNATYSSGGAAKACIRLHKSLKKQGVDSELLMLDKMDSDAHDFYSFHTENYRAEKNATPIIRRFANKFLYELGKGEEAANDRRQKTEKDIAKNLKSVETMTFASSPYRIHTHPLFDTVQLVHMHCMNVGFLDYASFFRYNSKPVVWTLHDMNAFTGGCTYTDNCNGFARECSQCPQLEGTDYLDYTQQTLKIKLKSMQSVKNLTVVSPSRWLMNESKKSRLFCDFPHRHIPYGIDSAIFQPRDREYSRQILGIPTNKPVVLFVAHGIHNKRKGYDYLIKAFGELQLHGKVTLCAVGGKSGNAQPDFFELGSFTDERLMSIAYSAADVFVIPSLEDNLPNTVIESLLCGTPVIGFPIGGIPDMVRHGSNGLLCANVSVEALKMQLSAFFVNPHSFDRAAIRQDAVAEYDSYVQTNRYIELYKEILRIN